MSSCQSSSKDKKKEFLRQFHIINDADDELAEIQDELGDMEQEFCVEVRNAIYNYIAKVENQ